MECWASWASPQFPESSSTTAAFFWLFSLQSPWAVGRQRNERVCYPIRIVHVRPCTLAQDCICLEQRCLSDCPLGWWAHALPSLYPVSESSSPPRCSQPLPHPFLLSLSFSSPTSRSHADGIQMCIPVPILAVSGMSYYLLRLMSIPDLSLPTLCSPYPVAMAVSLTDFGPPKPKASTALRLTPSFPYTQYIARPQYSLESSRRLSPSMRPSLCAPNPVFSVSPHVHRVCG